MLAFLRQAIEPRYQVVDGIYLPSSYYQRFTGQLAISNPDISWACQYKISENKVS
ncbi:hypothetical protein NUACC26_092260 [Scytonema sp. NUACC26]